MTKSLNGFLLAFSLSLIAREVSAYDLMQLGGKSIRSVYVEELSGSPPLRVIYRDDLYISSQGRIFHHFRVEGNSELVRGGRDAVSGESGSLPFVLNGNMLSRSWVNPKTGRQLRETIVLSGTEPGAPCRVRVERFPPLTYSVLSQSCSVLKGNIVGQ
jgi:hypothetical protein